MSQQDVGVLSMEEITLPSKAKSGWTQTSGITIIRNGQESQPAYELPGKIRMSAPLVFDDQNIFHLDDYGIISFRRGVLNGWAKYRLDSYDPMNAEFICVLRDGEIVNPAVALRELRGALTSE